MTALFAWFTGLDLRGKALALLIAVILAGVAAMTALHLVDALFDAHEEKGALTERAATQGKVIENAGKSKAAADAVRRDGGPARDDCLRDSRTPENC